MTDEPRLCPCFPGNCRGGEVIDGFTVIGEQCKAWEWSNSPVGGVIEPKEFYPHVINDTHPPDDMSSVEVHEITQHMLFALAHKHKDMKGAQCTRDLIALHSEGLKLADVQPKSYATLYAALSNDL